jgi:hypothetical protein
VRTPGAIRSRHLRPIVAAALTALPWAWFALRDSTGGVGDVLAILFPVLMAGLVLFGIGIVGGTRQPGWLVPTGSALLVGLLATLGPWLPAAAGSVRPGAGSRSSAPTCGSPGSPCRRCSRPPRTCWSSPS